MGKNQYLSQIGSDLVKRFKTRDPFTIAEALGIEVIFCDGFGPLKGMYRVVHTFFCYSPTSSNPAFVRITALL